MLKFTYKVDFRKDKIIMIEERQKIPTNGIIQEVKSKMESTCIDLDYVINHTDFTFGLCEFIDEFKRSENKSGLIKKSPQAIDATKENLCILAATVHKLANDYGLTVPDWVFDPIYKMSYPVFAHNTTNSEYQQFLISDSPFEFAEKNVFFGSRAIERI